MTHDLGLYSVNIQDNNFEDYYCQHFKDKSLDMISPPGVDNENMVGHSSNDQEILLSTVDPFVDIAVTSCSNSIHDNIDTKIINNMESISNNIQLPFDNSIDFNISFNNNDTDSHHFDEDSFHLLDNITHESLIPSTGVDVSDIAATDVSHDIPDFEFISNKALVDSILSAENSSTSLCNSSDTPSLEPNKTYLACSNIDTSCTSVSTVKSSTELNNTHVNPPITNTSCASDTNISSENVGIYTKTESNTNSSNLLIQHTDIEFSTGNHNLEQSTEQQLQGINATETENDTNSNCGINEPYVMQTCIRDGCENSAISNPEWENEYCSNECVIIHCHFIVIDHETYRRMQAQGPSSQEKLDNISKVKTLTLQLRDSLSFLMKMASEALRVNNLIDVGSSKTSENQIRFDKAFEDFYAICDQIEYNLKTSMECYQQGLSSQRYLPLGINPTRIEPGPCLDVNVLSYPQYLTTVHSQISYLKEIHDLLLEASQNIIGLD